MPDNKLVPTLTDYIKWYLKNLARKLVPKPLRPKPRPPIMR